MLIKEHIHLNLYYSSPELCEQAYTVCNEMHIQGVVKFDRRFQRGDCSHREEQKLERNILLETSILFKNKCCFTLTQLRLLVMMQKTEVSYNETYNRHARFREKM